MNLNLILLTISTLFLKISGASPEILLDCIFDYVPNSHIRRGHYKCEITSFSLPNEVISMEFHFNLTLLEKEMVKSLQFTSFDKVDFIPHNIVLEFPNLEALEIISSNLTEIGNKFFQWEMWQLKCLNLSSNQIEKIEEKSFWELTNLEIVDFSSNRIENITDKIFQKNLRLRIVNLAGNRIKMVIPRLFNELRNLNLVDFSSNECVDEQFRSSNGSLALLPRKLEVCQENCLRYINCLFNMWKSDPQLLPPEMREMLRFY